VRNYLEITKKLLRNNGEIIEKQEILKLSRNYRGARNFIEKLLRNEKLSRNFLEFEK